jgi:CelD/BcsL family acetyltransferase involved in cellulose biosynthesis
MLAPGVNSTPTIGVSKAPARHPRACYVRSAVVCTNAVNIHTINPLSDRRWDDLVARHPQASAFHQRGWLEALACTYGYKPLVLTTAADGEPLSDGIVLCRVSSWITGTRLVSLPFADHCEPLLNSHSESADFMDCLRRACDRGRWRYVEMRPLSCAPEVGAGLRSSGSYWTHELDTTPSLEEIFRGLHKNSFRRKIRRAEKEHLCYETGASQSLLDEFYRLLLVTRRRHLLLPQPRTWFKNLAQFMGDKVQISVARKDGTAVGAMLTLRHQSSIVYKYGCSDERYHKFGVMPFLFWKLVEEAKSSNVSKIDFGRTDLDNEGLVRFKDRFGTTRKLMTYYRYSHGTERKTVSGWNSRGFRGFCSILPDTLFATAGGVLYRHIG